MFNEKSLCFSGNMAAFDMSDPKSIVSPGGVGFDINCGVRLLRTNLHEKDVQPIKVTLCVYIIPTNGQFCMTNYICNLF